MKKILRLTFALLCFISLPAFAATSSSLPVDPPGKIYGDAAVLKTIVNLSVDDVQNRLGRKLTFKEKIAFKVYKWQAKRKLRADDEGSQLGRTAQTLGIVGVSSLVAGFIFPPLILAAIPLGILALIKGSRAVNEDPSDHRGRTGKTLGIITLAGLALVVILVAAVIAAWDW